MADASPRYRAHAHRADTLRGVSAEPAASYWAGYRLGMARTLRDDPEPQSDDERARDRYVAAALAGEQAGGLSEYARWCGYHDGMHWPDASAHRGLLRLAVAVSGLSNRAFAGALGPPLDEASLRQMLAGTRPVPATRHAELLDLVSGSLEWENPGHPFPALRGCSDARLAGALDHAR